MMHGETTSSKHDFYLTISNAVSKGKRHNQIKGYSTTASEDIF